MEFSSPVFHRLTIAALLMLTFATGLVDAVSVLVLGRVFVANMTGNLVFLGFWFVKSGIDLTGGVMSFCGFLSGAVIGGRLFRTLRHEPRRWLTTALGIEVVLLTVLSILAGTGVLRYHDNTKLFLLGGLAVTFGIQNATARQFGIHELSTTVLTSTIVGIGVESRLAGGTGDRQALRIGVVLSLCSGAVLGATLSNFVIAPVLGLAGIVVAFSLLIFRFGPADRKTAAALTS
jgi:uncharacterized membrane protein YoaK (UPF0700 family)